MAHLHHGGCCNAVDVSDWNAEEDLIPLLHRLSASVKVLGPMGAGVSSNGRITKQGSFCNGNFGGVQMKLDRSCEGGQMLDIGK